MMDSKDEYQGLFPLMNLLFEGNKIRRPNMKATFKEFNNDYVNKEQEQNLEKHFIDWFKHINNIPDSEDEEEQS
jgi:hypothetical protein